MNAMEQMIEKMSDYMQLNSEEKTLLLAHTQIHTAELTLGKKTFDAYRIIHNNALGPGKGGIRFHPKADLEEVKHLSFWMSIKNSLAGLPFGGAKGAIAIDTQQINAKELEEISRSYIQAFHEHIGQDKDIPAPDMYTTPQIMAWMNDEFESIYNRKEPAMITGKPLDCGGIKLRNDSTSKGGFIIMNEIFKDKKPLRIAIQGFGNAGYYAAKFLYDAGHTIIAVSDSHGGIIEMNGLNIPQVKEHKDSKGHLEGFATAISNNELLTLNVDVLILAAMENQITKDNASFIEAKHIIELANGPISVEADSILHRKGLIVVPDILANCGGVVGSYYEWVQGKTGFILSDEEIEEKFEKKMRETFNKVYFEWKKSTQDMRTIAYSIAIKRILNAEHLRGRI